jgi:hypothetical protein
MVCRDADYVSRDKDEHDEKCPFRASFIEMRLGYMAPIQLRFIEASAQID